MNDRRDRVFESAQERSSDFEFNAEVANAFDDMVSRSVPFYDEQQSMIARLARDFWVPGTNVFDLGCSTGTTLINLARQLPEPARLIGYDNSEDMLEHGRVKVAESGLQERIELKSLDLNAGLAHGALANASVVTMFLTLQFIRPLERDKLVRWVYDGLVNGGVLLVGEKILTNNGNLNRFYIDFYYRFKKEQGYSDTEIARKREALENVLIPYRLDEDLELFRRNGFEVVETFFQWFNFAAFLCIKKPGRQDSE